MASPSIRTIDYSLQVALQVERVHFLACAAAALALVRIRNVICCKLLVLILKPLGTDIGGSIRSPAANNGIFGFRPTAYRLPVKGMEHTMGGAEQILGVIGPLSTSIEGIKLFMQTLIGAQPWFIEPSLIPLPWRSNPAGFASSKRKIRVAVMYHDGAVLSHPPVRRALRETVAKMQWNELVEVIPLSLIHI